MGHFFHSEDGRRLAVAVVGDEVDVTVRSLADIPNASHLRHQRFFADHTLTVERLKVFDFEAMRAYPVLLEPLLFYVMHRVVARIQDPAEAAALKVCVIDEAWRFIQHPTLRAYVQEGLKTWRKRNAAMILATQTVEDFASADLLRTIVESCPTKLLLANPALDRRHRVPPRAAVPRQD